MNGHGAEAGRRHLENHNPISNVNSADSNIFQVDHPIDIIKEGGAEASPWNFCRYFAQFIPLVLVTIYQNFKAEWIRRHLTSNIAYFALFLLHISDVLLDGFFFYTVRIRFETFFFFQVIFLVLPFLLVMIKHFWNVRSTGLKMAILNILIDWTGINNIWEPSLGWFPCSKCQEYKELNHMKRLVFYICEDLP